jgi:hypothetical protein
MRVSPWPEVVLSQSSITGGRVILVSRHWLLDYGIARSCLSDAAAGKPDDVLAAKLSTAEHCLVVRLVLEAARGCCASVPQT